MKADKDIRLALIVLLSIAFLFIVKFVGTFMVNEIIKDYYHNRVYRDDLINTLYIANLTEREVAYYNHGNILFKQGKYEEAKARYEKALTYVDEKNKHACPILNNYAATLVYLADGDTKEEIIAELENAKNQLYRYGCAGEGEEDGSSQNSDNLEKEIDKAIQEMQNGDQQDQTVEDKEKDKELQDQLEKQEKESRSERQDQTQDNGKNNNSNSKSW